MVLTFRIPRNCQEALETDNNLLHDIDYAVATDKQRKKLAREIETVKALARHHVGVDSQTNVTVNWKGCIAGAFNLAFPIAIERPDLPPIKLFFRAAMPHKLGENRSAGAIDEKMRCEVATYAWMQEKCPDIRIPYLYGFGLYDHSQFTHQSQRPLLTRFVQYLRRLFLGWFRPSTILSHYVPHPSQHRFFTAYMVLEDVSADGSRMLYETWAKKRDDVRLRQNLLRDHAKLVISLARVPQPRIGSFRFHSDGTITLSNRPLSSTLAILENDGAPRVIPRDRTYTTPQLYISDMLSFHAGRLSTHPNSAFDEEELRVEMAVQVAFRAIAHDYLQPERRDGPFYLQFDDLHMSNIFVDENWNISSIVDLEFVNARPLEMMQAPHWLENVDLSSFKDEQLESFKEKRLEYMEIFQDEERKAALTGETFLTDTINWSWERQGSWFWVGIESLNAMLCMFRDLVRLRYGVPYTNGMAKTLSLLWCADNEEFVARRLKDFAAYRSDLEAFYARELPKIEARERKKTGDDGAKEEHASNGHDNNDGAKEEHASNGHDNNGHASNEQASNEHAGNDGAKEEHAGNGHDNNGHASNDGAKEEHASNKHASNGHASNGHASNGHVSNEHAGNGHASNEHASNEHASNDGGKEEHASNGHASDEHAGNKHASNEHASN
ncbi:hypothetical protein E4U53_006079 [Claviceps sorghi]|nr:hypothetical protein E4U53_006079 [Claviceps sorghi]